MSTPRIPAELLQLQVAAWQEVPFSTERAQAIESDVNRFNDAALAVAEDMAFEAEPTSFAQALDAWAED
jgi:hypothetical protein